MVDGIEWLKGLFDKVSSMPSDALAQLMPPEAIGGLFNSTGVNIGDAMPLGESGGPNAAGPAQSSGGQYSLPLPPNGLGEGGNYFGPANPAVDGGSTGLADILQPKANPVPAGWGPGPESFPMASNPDPLAKPGPGLTSEQILALQKAMPGNQPTNYPSPGSPAGARGLSNVGSIGPGPQQGQRGQLPGTLRSLIYGR